MRLSGVQNPTPVSHSTIIDHMAIMAPPSMPPSAPERSACLSMPPPRDWSFRVADSRRVLLDEAARNVTTMTVFGGGGRAAWRR
jgi:hypothetical protein